MSVWEWILIAELAISGLAIFVRGVLGSERRYTLVDALLGPVEMAFLIWIVVTKL